jgi:S-(hydroxymethyl)glutathione dehydrogenase / alcohol dehydrogenase
VPCGVCRQCRRHMPEHCNGAERRQAISGLMADGTSRLRYDGAPAYPFFGVGSLAEYSTVRQEQAVKIDDDLPLDEFCLTGCGVVTGVGAVLNTADVQIGDTVAVIGCGGVGINVIQAAKAAGATKIVAIDAITEKLELAKSVGATHGIDARGDVAAELAAIEPEGADVAFEVVGRPELMEAALSYTRAGGTAVMVGIPPMGSKFTFDAFSVNANRRILGCRGGSVIAERDIGRLVTMYRGGALDLGILVGQRIDLDSVFTALDALGSSTFARSVVTF